jgi:integrase
MPKGCSVATILTKTAIESAVTKGLKGQRIELADEREFGLRLRVGARGAKWSVMSRLPTGERIRVPLGAWPGLGISEARHQAQTAKRSIERGENLNATRHAARDHMKVSELIETYYQLKLSHLRKGGDAKRSLARLFRAVAKNDPASITRQQIVTALDRLALTAPIGANRTLAYCRAFLNWAVGRGHIDVNPSLGIPKPSPERIRERTPTLDEVVEIWRASEELGYPFGPAVQLLIVLPMRREEISSIRLSEMEISNFENRGGGVWTLPSERTKNGRAIRVPLPPLAYEIISATRCNPMRPNQCDLLFSTTGETPPSGWTKAKRRLDSIIGKNRWRAGNAAEMPHWRIHDFRRSFATLACDELQIDPTVADRCLNHVGAATTSTISRVYARNEMFEQRKAALTAWSALLQSRLAAERASLVCVG